jgi:23S rRNA (adenine2030-N6)-methyltransferase
MKYRHSFHAGNFADVHKHAVLVALLQALERKDKGFLYLETHAGEGAYDLKASPGAVREAIEQLLAAVPEDPELVAYASAITTLRARSGNARSYPGSPLIAAHLLRPQDRALLVEVLPQEAAALEQTLAGHAGVRVAVGDGFELLRAHLPPPERRGLTFIDPPYEDTQRDFVEVGAAIGEALRRFQTGVIAVWYPIKDARDTGSWLGGLLPRIGRPVLVSELAIHPCDSRVALNGSGMLIVNPPWQVDERMQAWLPKLHALLSPTRSGGTSVRSSIPG